MHPQTDPLRGIAPETLTEEYLDRVDATFHRVPTSAMTDTCNTLIDQLLTLPADFLLEDLPGLAVAYHGQISSDHGTYDVSKHLIMAHQRLMNHLSWDPRQQSRWIAFVAGIQADASLPRQPDLPDSPEVDPLDSLFDTLEDPA